MSSDVGKATEGTEKSLSVTSTTSQLILQPFRHFTNVSTHSPTLPPLYLRHSSFSKLSVTSPMPQLILQPFRRFSYVTVFLQLFRCFTNVTAHSPTSSFASPTSQALHLRHLASRPCHPATALISAMQLTKCNVKRGCKKTKLYCLFVRILSQDLKILKGIIAF